MRPVIPEPEPLSLLSEHPNDAHQTSDTLVLFSLHLPPADLRTGPALKNESTVEESFILFHLCVVGAFRPELLVNSERLFTKVPSGICVFSALLCVLETS